jgi:hypothetical protein
MREQIQQIISSDFITESQAADQTFQTANSVFRRRSYPEVG